MSQNNNAVLGDLKVIVSWCFSLQQQAIRSLSMRLYRVQHESATENRKIESVFISDFITVVDN